jgi:CheY-like chemotaxis protein
LQQEDTFLLMAVITGLERLACALIIERLRELLAAESVRSARIIETIAAARAVNLFDGLYQDERIGKALIAAIARLNDADVIADFYMWLQSRGDERSFADSDILEHAIIQDTERRMLAADDSLAMLQFYRTVAADLGMDITTVQSFGAALEELKKAGAGGYCLVIADMHLHDMDSMEFVRAVRDTLRLRDLSIIMAATAVEERQMKLFRQTGVTDFIRKPCEPDAVKRILLASLAAG